MDNKNINKFIKTPLNYTGNKFRILNQIFDIMPEKCGVFVDLFCGGGSIGFNYPSTHTFMIDSNKKVVDLLSYLSNKNFLSFYSELSFLIKKYNLTFSYEKTYKFYKDQINYENQSSNNGLKSINAKGFYLMREDYNNMNNKNSSKAKNLLYLLMVYAFNNDLRFNSSGLFNVPVGKTDMNKANVLRLKNFLDSTSTSKFTFITGDFRSKEVMDILKIADVIYADPPYLGTTAVYNSSPSWTLREERDLLELSKELLAKNKKIYISNMIKESEKESRLLCEFVLKNNYKIHNIDYHYRGASHNKKNRKETEQEILVEVV